MLIDQIKKDRIQAMKDKDTLKKDLLSTLIGDIDKSLKVGSDGKKIPANDTEVISTIKAYIKTIREKVLPHLAELSVEWDHAQTEWNILESYLPKQLSMEGLRTAVKFAVEFDGATNLGAVMKYLKTNHEGRYDGTVASQMAKEVLNVK